RVGTLLEAFVELMGRRDGCSKGKIVAFLVDMINEIIVQDVIRMGFDMNHLIKCLCNRVENENFRKQRSLAELHRVSTNSFHC
ncbi:hypothetical protein FRX31_012320, partial [Thalictrum thalictroides]